MMPRHFMRVVSFLTMLSVVTFITTSIADDEAEDKIARLIQHLDGESYSVRQSAAEQLTELGKPAVAQLAQAATVPSFEVRFRAMDILARLLTSEDEDTRTVVRAALEELCKSDINRTARLALKILAAPAYELPAGIWRGEGKAPVFGGLRKLSFGGPGGVSITGAGINIGAGGQLILVEVSDAGRRVDFLRGTGQGVLLLERSGKKGIEMHFRNTGDGGQPQYIRYLAGDAAELEKDHPAIYTIYQQLDAYRANGTIIGGVQLTWPDES